MSKLSLKLKLILGFLLAGLVPTLTISFYAMTMSSESLEEQEFAILQAVQTVKGEAVKRYFEGINNQILTFSHDVMVVDAMDGFKSAFNRFEEENNITANDIKKYKRSLQSYYNNQFRKKYEKENNKSIDVDRYLNQLSNKEIALQHYYISANPNPLGEKETLDYAEDSSEYSKLHKKYHPSIREYLQKFGYYDIFLVDIDTGNIVYSVFKELDYATSLSNGPYSNTNFAKAFSQAKAINNKDDAVLVDYENYTPSYEAPASFIATPVWNGDKKIGVAIFQMPIDRLNAIMGERAGMGETGETYLVGPDHLARSDSYLDAENRTVLNSHKYPEKGKISTASVEAALAGKSGLKISKNYLNYEVLVSYAPIKILGLPWAIIAEKSTKEAFASIASLRNAVWLVVGVSSLLILILSFWVSSSLSSAINRVVKRLREGANQVANSSEDISFSSQQLSEAATEQASGLQETVSSVDEINAMVSRNAEAAQNSTKVSESSTQAAIRGKDTVEAMISSINDIAQSNDEIMGEMQNNNEEISKIVHVIAEIGEKTKVINDIVFQTKLLSFNASVEAARAGEHGKGFAVVAEEVGNLASMSGKAAHEITEMLDKSISQVTQIVESTKSKVESLVRVGKDKVATGTETAQECGRALDEILTNVSSVNEMVREISNASSEQAQGIKEVNAAMRSLDEVTHQNTSVAQKSSQMANDLREQASSLNEAVSDLMIVVSGSGSGIENSNLKSKQASTGNQAKPARTASIGTDSIAKVIPLNSNSTANSNQKIDSDKNSGMQKKVAGGGLATPSSNDPRFEEL